MKRVLSIILALVLMYGTTISSHAETTDATKQAISFRGIPWGCSPSVALEMLEEQFGDDIIEVQSYEVKSKPYCQYDEDDKSQKAGYRIPMLRYYVKVENCTIAGYATGGFYLYFIPELSEDKQSYCKSRYNICDLHSNVLHRVYKMDWSDILGKKKQ